MAGKQSGYGRRVSLATSKKQPTRFVAEIINVATVEAEKAIESAGQGQVIAREVALVRRTAGERQHNRGWSVPGEEASPDATSPRHGWRSPPPVADTGEE